MESHALWHRVKQCSSLQRHDGKRKSVETKRFCLSAAAADDKKLLTHREVDWVTGLTWIGHRTASNPRAEEARRSPALQVSSDSERLFGDQAVLRLLKQNCSDLEWLTVTAFKIFRPQCLRVWLSCTILTRCAESPVLNDWFVRTSKTKDAAWRCI